MISDAIAGNMNEAFWLMWKLATPVLAVVTLLLLVERRQQQRRADGLWQSIVAYRREKNELVARLAEAQIEAAEAKSIANILRHRNEATCPCSQVKAANERMAYLEDRNQQLTLNALVDGVKFIKIYPN